MVPEKGRQESGLGLAYPEKVPAYAPCELYDEARRGWEIGGCRVFINNLVHLLQDFVTSSISW